MSLPILPESTYKTQSAIIAFGGINYGTNFSEGELSDCLNLSSRRLPALYQRRQRKVLPNYENCSHIYYKDYLLVVSGTDLIYDGEKVGTVSNGEKKIASINTKIVIFPDKIYLDTETREVHNLAADYSVYAGNAVFDTSSITISSVNFAAFPVGSESVELDGTQKVTKYTKATISEMGALSLTGNSSVYPSELKAGDILNIDCESNEYLWVEEVTTYKTSNDASVKWVKRRVGNWSYPDLSEYFAVGDTVNIYGNTIDEKNNGYHTIRGVEKNAESLDLKLTFDDNTFAEGTEPNQIEIKREIPDLDFICECDNRIWGTSKNTIYGSALGDPTNFFTYQALSTDSYAVAVGTSGEFTGCVSYSSTVLFFKEDCVHKLLGSTPSTYEIRTYTWPGVQKESEKSLCVIDETLFYKSREGVYAYSGGAPVLVSSNFGEKRFFSAVGGTDGSKYYISMEDENGSWGLYVYDIQKGIWLKEDNNPILGFAFFNGILYMIDGYSKEILQSGSNINSDEKIEWNATFCPFDEGEFRKKQYGRIYIRAEIQAGSWLTIETSVDGNPFRRVYAAHRNSDATIEVPIRTTRCNRFQLRLSGKGYCTIKGIARDNYVGGYR